MSRIVLNLRRQAGPHDVIFNQKIDPETRRQLRELLDQQIRKEKAEQERKDQVALKPSHPVLFHQRIRFRQKPDKKVFEQPVRMSRVTVRLVLNDPTAVARRIAATTLRTADLRDYASSELAFLGSGPMDRAMRDHVMKLIEVFREEGHSGFSAATASRMFDRLSRFKPIRPLTGADDEWNEVTGATDLPPMLQNRRCPSVFKDQDGAYDLDATVFEDPDGVRYTNGQSRRPVQFPYEVPDEPVVIRVDHDGRPVQNVAHARQLVAVARRLVEAAATTFQAARSAILDDLQRRGWKVVSGLKIPHATSPHGQLRLWFKAQAVYFTEDLNARSDRNGHAFGHARTISYDLDIRTLTPDEFYAYLKRAFPEALKFDT